MKIVQSSWSCNQNDLLTFKAGWYAPEYHLMGWALSCLQLRKFYSEVVLYADSVTAKMLIDTLRLPYTGLEYHIDELNSYHPSLWAFPKIHTYARQDTPFLHVDGDVMIWKPFEEQLLKGSLIAQNLEMSTSHYENMMRSIKAALIYTPNEIVAEGKKNNQISSYNAGILGGNDVTFLNLYANKAIEFVDRNVACLSKIDIGGFNILFEQFLFHSMVQQSNKKVSVLFDDIIGDNQYIGFGDFIEVPHNKQYLHLIGTYKRNRKVCEQLANRLRQDYPEYYYRIIALFKNSQTPLKKDHYYFVGKSTEQALTKRHALLKRGLAKGELLLDENNVNEHQFKRFRVALVENVIALAENGQEINSRNTDLLEDARSFEEQLAYIVQNKFKAYSKEFLYQRDIIHTNYFQIIFGNKGDQCPKKITLDKSIEIIESKFDWSEMDNEEETMMSVVHNLEDQLPVFNMAIIPECDMLGYSLASLDSLDLLLLQIFEKPLTINELLNETKSFFDPVELETSLAEFELLITGRVKLAIEKKLIKAII